MITQTTQIDSNTDVQQKKVVPSDVKDNSMEQFRAETQRQIKNRAVFQKIRRHLNAGHLVQMKEPESGVYATVAKVDHCDDQLIGDCGVNQLPWDKLTGDHVMIGNETLRLNAKPTTKAIDPGMKLLDLAAALNSMTGVHDGSVFIASIHVESDDFFHVERFMTDGDRLYAVTGHDGTCRDLVGGWVYDLRYRRYVYGEGGPLRDGIQ